jgi:signal transduction histidine kinase
MSNASAHDDIGVSQGTAEPSCQWSFNRAHEFHHVSGDSTGLFHRLPIDLSRRHVSIIDDPPGTWSARIDRIFQGDAPMEQSLLAGPAGEYAVFHIPVRAGDGTVLYVAGFAFPADSALPAAPELELAAATILQVVDSERTRATRFLHDVVAQSLSGTGFQLELLQLEIQAQSAEALKRIAEIQRSLEEVLKLIREFNSPE